MTIEVIVSGGAAAASKEYVPELVLDKVASRLFDKDHTLWGKDAESEATIRLGWVDAASKSLEIVPEVEELRRELLSRGLNRVVLCGMGGSSLAPEVITKTFGKELVVLDSTDPTQVRQALEADLASTVVVVSSKSGSTVETDSQKRSFEQAFDDAGIEKTDRIFIVTDPDSPMHRQAIKDGYRVFLADPMVGGRYSALTAFGIVPSVLAGVDLVPVLEDAISASLSLRQDDQANPGLVLGSALARTRMSSGFKDKVGIVSSESGIVGFGDWAEQLIAESTGKIGRGVLPVVLEKSAIELTVRNQDILVIELSSDASQAHEEVVVSATLGEQLVLWEVATVIASRLLGVNPFDQPDVESAKIAARTMLDSPASKSVFTFEDGSISGATLGFSTSASDLESALDGLFEQAQSDSYIAIHCYLNRESMGEVVALRNLIALKTGRPTTFGWGPRFLHSTGQYHKGGPKQGVFLQLVSGLLDDLAIPGREFGYRQLIKSQASGDAKVLAEKGSPVLVLQLSNPTEGIDRLIGILS